MAFAYDADLATIPRQLCTSALPRGAVNSAFATQIQVAGEVQACTRRAFRHHRAMTTPENTPAPEPKKRGCFFYGCLSLVILSLVGAVVLYLGYRYAMKTVAQFADQYTENAPVIIESVEVRPDQLRGLQDRVSKFVGGLGGAQAEELVLTAEDINALIAGDASFKDARNRLFVRIEGDKVRGKVSWPLQDMGPLKLKGRYINGEAALNVALTNGTLWVGLLDMTVKGKSLPPEFTTALRQENLAKEVMNDPKVAEKFAKFDRIEVKDGKLILRNKPAAKP